MMNHFLIFITKKKALSSLVNDLKRKAKNYDGFIKIMEIIVIIYLSQLARFNIIVELDKKSSNRKLIS